MNSNGSLKIKIKEETEKITRERPVKEKLGAGEQLVLFHLNPKGKRFKKLKEELPDIRNLRSILVRLEKQGLVSREGARTRWLTTEKGERLKKTLEEV